MKLSTIRNAVLVAVSITALILMFYNLRTEDQKKDFVFINQTQYEFR